MTAAGELEPAVPRWHGAGHGARPAHCDADRAAAAVSHLVRCASRGATDMQAVERRRRICAGLARRWRAGAARAGLGPCPKGRKYITGIIGRPPVGSLRPKERTNNNRQLCKGHKQARAVTARNRRASPAPAQSVERRRGWLGAWHRRPWTSIRPNSAATDQERRAEITDSRGRSEFTVPLSKYHHFDIVLILKRYRMYSHSSPAPAYAWERGRVPGGGGRGRRSSGRGVKVQAARRQAIGRREGRPGRSRGGRLAGRA